MHIFCETPRLGNLKFKKFKKNCAVGNGTTLTKPLFVPVGVSMIKLDSFKE